MAAVQPKYDTNEFARRGDEIFETSIKSVIPPGHDDDYVLIDIETGAFEYDRDERAAADRLEARLPNAQVWMRRIGSPFARQFGAPKRIERRCLLAK